MKKILGLIVLCLFFFNPIFAEERSEIEIKNGIFDFAQHREPENYKLITETKGVKIEGSD